jgi:hypothetical protein
MSKNNLRDGGVQSIAVALASNVTMTRLNLSFTQCGSRGAQAIAALLESNSTITDLNLKWNHIKGEGAYSIAEVNNLFYKNLLFCHCHLHLQRTF